MSPVDLTMTINIIQDAPYLATLQDVAAQAIEQGANTNMFIRMSS